MSEYGVGLAEDNKAVTAASIQLEFDGFRIRFSEVVGVTNTINVPPTVALKRDMTDSRDLADWHNQALVGGITAAKKNCGLVMYSANGSPLVRHELEGAWPSKLEIRSAPVLTETLTLVCDSIQRT